MGDLKIMTKNEFIQRRTDIISELLDNPDNAGIYPTTKAFSKLDDLFDELTINIKTESERGKSWAQIETKQKDEVKGE